MAHPNSTTGRYCRVCGDVELIEDVEPCGDPSLSCPQCKHSVEPSTIEYSTLAAPRRQYNTLRRRLSVQAIEVGRKLNEQQTADEWSTSRQATIYALLAFTDALNGDTGALDRLAAVEVQ